MATTESVKRARLDVPAEGYERWGDYDHVIQASMAYLDARESD